jgi:hypothetical protein
MALVFPPSPSIGDRYPDNPGVSGTTQYVFVGGNQWNAVTSSVSLGIANQGASVGVDTFNSYKWPAADGVAGRQLTTDGAGNLSWGVTAAPALEILSLLEPIDGIASAFTLVLAGTSTPYTPVPSTNIVVFLGGVPQIPTAAYTVSGNTITFTEAPLTGSTFYAISSTVV